MNTGFSLFSFQHLLILAMIPALAGILAYLATTRKLPQTRILFFLGLTLALSELAWYSYVIAVGWYSFPEFLPLHLCDITLWLAFIAAFSRNQYCFELAYYWGLGGTTMALLTPDLGFQLPSYPSIQFFLSHGLVVVIILFSVWSGAMKPGKHSHWKAFIALNVYAAIIGIFNFAFDTNYMYLCEKPASASLLDWLGSWPLYIVVSDALALLVFWLLRLPYRRIED